MNMWDVRTTFCCCFKKKKKEKLTNASAWALLCQQLNSQSDQVQTGRRENSNTFFLSWDQFSVSPWADTWAHLKTQHSTLFSKLADHPTYNGWIYLLNVLCHGDEMCCYFPTRFLVSFECHWPSFSSAWLTLAFATAHTDYITTLWLDKMRDNRFI